MNTPRKTQPDESAEARRRRIAAVFGEVLPDTTADERDPEGTDDRGDGDSWLRAQVPPHHG
jgi:hypothetical protein